MADLDLARALVAAPWWEWREGMAYHENATPGMGLCRGGRGRVWADGEAVPHAATPDLTDAATAGILLDMLGPADVQWSYDSGVPRYLIAPESSGWEVAAEGSTLGEAAARALLTLWGPA